MEVREKELSVFLDAKQAQRWVTLCGEAPKMSIDLGAGGNEERELARRDADVSFQAGEDTQGEVWRLTDDMKKCLFIFALVTATSTMQALDIGWVAVGGSGNAPDKTDYGAVADELQNSKQEVTLKQDAEFPNALAVRRNPLRTPSRWGVFQTPQAITARLIRAAAPGCGSRQSSLLGCAGFGEVA